MYDMITDTIIICDNNNAVWTGKTFFTNPFTELKSLVQQIEQRRVVQEVNTTGFTDARQEKRDLLEDAALKMSRALVLHAINTNDPALRKIVARTPTQLDNMSFDALISFSSTLIERATAERPTISAQLGVTQAVIDSLADRRDDLVAARAPQTTAKEATVNATQDLIVLFNDVRDLLTDKLDPAVDFFEFTNPEFAQQYNIARRINGPSVATRALSIHVGDAATTNALQGVDLVINPGGIARTTSELGNSYVQSLPPGEVTVVASMPGYQSKTVTDFIVDGQTTRLVIALEAL